MTAPTTDELHGSTNVVLFSPHFALHPVFHRLGYHFDPDIPQAHRDRLGVPEGFSATYEHPFSIVELRLDQAAAFGRPCRRCFTVPPTD